MEAGRLVHDGNNYGSIESDHFQDNNTGTDSTVEEGTSNSAKKNLTIVSALVLVVCGAFLAVVYRGGSSPLTSSFFTSSSKNKIKGSFAGDISFTMTRSGYDPLSYFESSSDSDALKYAFLDNFNGVLEPSAANDLYIYDDDSSTSYYTYDICETSDTSSCSSGVLASSSSTSSDVTTTSVEVSCSAYDTYSITVKEYDSSSDEQLDEVSGSLVCMYVRRELRELSDDDLSTTLDAMKVMYDVDATTGRATYGDNFLSIDELIGFHFYNAAWQDGDHIHEGLGFFPQHLKLTNFFELSMQTVDPSTSLFFWDFTIEDAYNLTVSTSPMFTADTFGSMPTAPDATWGWLYSNAALEDARIPDGRWADAKTGVNTAYPSLLSAYGFMRAPWSMNPSPYITRFTSVDKSLPTCESHYNLAYYTDFIDVLKDAPYAAHASTHGVIGGEFGCDVFDDMLSNGYLLDEASQLSICKNWLFFMKEFYRGGYFAPKIGCSVNDTDTTSSTCGFECNTDVSDSMLEKIGTLLNANRQVTPEPMPQDDKVVWMDFICSGDGYRNFGGDHVEAASAADPSFWPIHPTLERLIQARYLVGGWKGFTWPLDPLSDYVCDKSYCYHSDNGTSYNDPACCNGHYNYSQIMQVNSAGDVYYTGLNNIDMINAIDPTSDSYSVPYIYSTFSWAHCTDEKGVDIDGLLQDFNSGDIDIMEAHTKSDRLAGRLKKTVS